MSNFFVSAIRSFSLIDKVKSAAFLSILFFVPLFQWQDENIYILSNIFLQVWLLYNDKWTYSNTYVCNASIQSTNAVHKYISRQKIQQKIQVVYYCFAVAYLQFLRLGYLAPTIFDILSQSGGFRHPEWKILLTLSTRKIKILNRPLHVRKKQFGNSIMESIQLKVR